METFIVTRIFWNGQGTRSNSCEEFDTFDLAKKRAYTILGSDIGKDSVSFEIVTILSAADGHQMFLETIDNRTPVEE